MKPALRTFLRANLSALLRGRLFMRNGHLPPAGHTVPHGFAGVGVATNADPATDEAVIRILRETGLSRVRLDYTYGDGENHVARFLDTLLTEGFKVTLHLVQPAEDAKHMEEATAVEQWRAFVRDTLDRFGPRIELLEAGSTVNRKRWAGYTLEGFLAAWRIVREETRQRGITLAGPSVTDFEPVWNVGLLALLREHDLLPDIHTDNLFSERCTEPERWDHKILGHRLAPLIRFNLIRKARLLQRIGADFGVPRLISPAAFWTLPRIERFLPDSEQKQADYLTRYMVLCAASGALEAAWWGPLVCHREGLVDDGDFPYPALERITHYAGVNGCAADFRTRPGLAALSTFARLIPGAIYEGRQNLGNGLEIHAFRNAEHLIHVAWTTNALAAASCDAYSPNDLATAQALCRDGKPLPEAPTLLSEAPVYLLWPADRSVVTRASASVLPDVRIHRHGAQALHYHRDAEWHGMVLADSADEASQLVAALHPERALPPPGRKQGAMRFARNVIWSIPDPRTPDRDLVLKKPVKHHLHKKLLDRFKPSKALRSWNGTIELQRRGIRAAPPVGWFEQRPLKSLTANTYACERVTEAIPISRAFAALRRGHIALPVSAHTLFESAAGFVCAMHDRGIYFRDLSGGNILMQADGEALQFSLIDTGRITLYPGRTPPAQRLLDLTRICHKLDREQRQRFMATYTRLQGRGKPLCTGFAFWLYDMKTGLKRRLRKTRLYKMLKF